MPFLPETLPGLPPLPVLSDAPDYLAADLDAPPLAQFEDEYQQDENAQGKQPNKKSEKSEKSESSEKSQNIAAGNLAPQNLTLNNVAGAEPKPNAAKEAQETQEVLGQTETETNAPVANRNFLPDVAPPPIPLQNGGQLSWQFSWQEPSSRRMRYLPRLEFSAELLQGMEGQTVEIVFQVDRQGRVVSASFAQFRAQNWEIGPALLQAVGQFVFETTSQTAEPRTETGGPNWLSPNWLSKGRVSFRFSAEAAAPAAAPN